MTSQHASAALSSADEPGPIRHVLLLKLKDGQSPDVLTPLTEAMRRLHVEGLVALNCGAVLPSPQVTWDWALTADFVDAASYQRYETDLAHRRVRKELAAPYAEAVARAQLRLRAFGSWLREAADDPGTAERTREI
jgi:Stress responsive A/B Barrel Domain